MANIWDQGGGSGGFGSYGAGPSGSNPFFQPGSTYGAPQSWNTTPIAGQIREKNPQLAFTQWAQGMGVADNDNQFNRWFLSQFPKFERGYGLATLQNPLITIDSFLRTLPSLGQMQQQFQMLSPAQRGENIQSFAPIARWIGR